MSNQTYGRGQVEWALWESFRSQRIKGKKVKKIFGTRIKRLLEADKGLKTDHLEVQPEASYAFAPAAESGESPYQAVDCFSIAVGLELLDAGFKQYDIAFLMRFMRCDFEKRFPKLISGPSLLSRARIPADRYPKSSSYHHNGSDWADGRHYLILRRFELSADNLPTGPGRHTSPNFIEPNFCAGIELLKAKLNNLMPRRGHVVTIVELAEIAQKVQANLEKAPVIRRGRPKASEQGLV